MREPYDTSWVDDVPSAKRHQHGMPWTAEEHTEVLRLYDLYRGDLQQICFRMGRTKNSIIAALKSQNLIHGNPNDGYYCGPKPAAICAPRPTCPYPFQAPTVQVLNSSYIPYTQEHFMTNTIPSINVNAFKIEHKVFIGGVDAASLTDQQLFSKIAEIQAHMKVLKTITDKPDSLKKFISRLLATSLALGVYLDTRNKQA